MDVLDNQTFTHRENPVDYDGTGTITEIKGNSLVWNQKVNNSKSGKAEIKELRGNTVKWNQFIENGNFADASGWSAGAAASIVISNNVCRLSHGGNSNASLTRPMTKPLEAGRKYLYKATFLSNKEINPRFGFNSDALLPKPNFGTIPANTKKTVSLINSVTDGGSGSSRIYIYPFLNGQYVAGDYVDISNIQVFDITDLSITTVEEFEALFPLPYYSYSLGRLINFGRPYRFNQILENGNFVSTSGWAGYKATISASNNILTANVTEEITSDSRGRIERSGLNCIVGHKYFITTEMLSPVALEYAPFFYLCNGVYAFNRPLPLNTWTKESKVVDITSISYQLLYIYFPKGTQSGQDVKYRNVQLFDLTTMFGAGNEPATAEEFEAWLLANGYTDDYYPYNTGDTLTGPKVKTVGKNLFEYTFQACNINAASQIQSNISGFDVHIAKIYKGKTYYPTTGIPGGGGFVYAVYEEFPIIGDQTYSQPAYDNARHVESVGVFTAPIDGYIAVRTEANYQYAMFELGTSATAFEPYIETTTTLPTTDYFPEGMKSVESVFDELTKNKVVQRVGKIKSSDEGWVYYSSLSAGGLHRVVYESSNIKLDGKALNSIGLPIDNQNAWNYSTPVMQVGTSSNFVRVYGTFTSLEEFKTQYANLEIYYELTTPLENFGLVDLSTFDWTYNSASGHQYFVAALSRNPSVSDIKPVQGNGDFANIVCSKYKCSSYNYVYQNYADLIIGIATNSSIGIRDTSFNGDVTTFKASLAGTYLYYEKATPTAPDLDLTYPVYDSGTEQLLPINGETPITSPLLADISYINGAPSEEEFVYKQTDTTNQNVTLLNGHSYLKRENGTWTTVAGTGQTISIQRGSNMLIDITQMADPSITTPEQFLSFFPNSLYDYEEGRLLSFNGTAIKTVGKNLYDLSKLVYTTDLAVTITGNSVRAVYGGGNRYVNINNFRSNPSEYINHVFPVGTKLTFSLDYTGNTTSWTLGLRNLSNSFIDSFPLSNQPSGHISGTVTVPDVDCYLSICRTQNTTSAFDVTFSNIQLEVGETETAYVPYQESEEWLPGQSFNIWDEQWEVGALSPSTGDPAVSNNQIRSKNFIPVHPNTTYYGYSIALAGSTIGNLVCNYYDEDKNFVSYGGGLNGVVNTIPSNVHYIKIWTGSAYGSMYNNDICINLSDPSLNGTYREYNNPLFPDGMDSAGSARDYIRPRAYGKKIGRIELGALTFFKETYGFVSYAIPNMLPTEDYTVKRIECADYCWSGAGKSAMPDMSIRENYAGAQAVFIRDSRYDDASEFKAAVSGKYLYYELATPIENFGVVDLGTLNYTYDSTNHRFSANISDIKKYGVNDAPNFMTKKYMSRSIAYFDAHQDESCLICGDNSLNRIFIRDLSFTDATEFKKAMQGVYLYFEKSTPATPDYDFTYPIYQDGTEQLIPVNGSYPATSPILADITYRGMIPVNAQDDPDGSGIITGNGDYRYHDQVTLHAAPADEIYRFLRWEDENGDVLSTDPTLSFEVGDDE